ncbi:MAG: anaerobic ribonucleoside-triphosphate reductase activating protein [Nitrospiraceae bacterium]|jgi:pyruvate formate lyase activating enzyme|nr:anaerobic ribonucleoside-triphosphate reductase activating protein [Nitrospiraceae bacterium]
MQIGGLQRSSLVDYPGSVSAVVFTQGCNFRCPYCHNPQLVEPSLFEPLLDAAGVLSFLESRVGRIGGVVVSGGEPLLHDDLPDFLDTLKGLGFSVKLDTNGSLPERLGAVLAARLADFVAMDIKAPLHKYQRVSGVSADTDAIQASIRIIRESGIDHQFRTTMAEMLLDSADIQSIRQDLVGTSRHVVQVMNSRAVLLDRSLSAA